MDWIISFKVSEKEGVEPLIKNFLSSFIFSSRDCQYYIKDIDALGAFGSQLTTKINYNPKGFGVTKSELTQLLDEDGQIIEFDLQVNCDETNKYEIIVRDGFAMDILGDGRKPSQQEIGPYTDLDKSLYGY